MNMATAYSAYTVYYYDYSVDPAVGYGMAGRIIDISGGAITPLPDMNTSLNGDPKVEGLMNYISNDLFVAATDRMAGQPELVYIHDVTDGSQVGTATWPTQNLYTLVNLGAYLYAIDYDQAMVVEINASTYAATGVTYPLDNSFIPAGYQAVGQALLVVDGTLYGLFSFPDSSFDEYEPSLIVRFSITPDTIDPSKNVISVAESNNGLAKNAFSFAANGSDIYVAAIGGAQSAGAYNADSRLQSLPADFDSSTAVTDVMSAGDDFPYEFRDVSFDGSGNAFVLAAVYNVNWNTDGLLFSTADFINLKPIDVFFNVSGYFWSAQYTPDRDRLWYARGNEVVVYAADDVRPIALPAPVTTLTVGEGSLISTGEQYTNLNDLTYVGSMGNRSLRGYRSPLQRANTPLARALRPITRGRPEATEEEREQAKASLKK
jgi:hypothetical protein